MSARLLLASLSLALCAGAAHATPIELVTNGGFESYNVAAGGWQTYNNIGGWSTTNGIEIRNNAEGKAFEGNNFAELDTSGNSAIGQYLATTAGTWYTLSFAYSPRANVGKDSNQIDVFWNNQSVTSVTADGLTGSGAGNSWNVYTFNLLATSDKTLLSFAAAGKSDSLGGGLDAVSVKVPEPASAALLGLGAAALLLSRRRKRG